MQWLDFRKISHRLIAYAVAWVLSLCAYAVWVSTFMSPTNPKTPYDPYIFYFKAVYEAATTYPEFNIILGLSLLSCLLLDRLFNKFCHKKKLFIAGVVVWGLDVHFWVCVVVADLLIVKHH